jgi:hypothetical protein
VGPESRQLITTLPADAVHNRSGIVALTSAFDAVVPDMVVASCGVGAFFIFASTKVPHYIIPYPSPFSWPSSSSPHRSLANTNLNAAANPPLRLLPTRVAEEEPHPHPLHRDGPQWHLGLRSDHAPWP